MNILKSNPNNLLNFNAPVQERIEYNGKTFQSARHLELYMTAQYTGDDLAATLIEKAVTTANAEKLKHRIKYNRDVDWPAAYPRIIETAARLKFESSEDHYDVLMTHGDAALLTVDSNHSMYINLLFQLKNEYKYAPLHMLEISTPFI